MLNPFPSFIGLLGVAALALLMTGCEKRQPRDALFTMLPKSKTGLDFRNLVREDENFNIFQYQYYYNGGGVAAGDFNNDGLTDLVFTGNMVKNRLFINKGNLRFHDGTLRSRIAEKEGWCTGVTTVDINADGWLDLYICRAGYPFEHLRRNLLFINNADPDASGTPSFTEKAPEYGLDDPAHATHAAFFDYDNDGDLDLFLLNHSTVEYSRGSLEVFPLKNKTNPDFTNKLLRNDTPPLGGNPLFTNVTLDAGITSNVLSFSLGLSIADFNLDGWQDLFIGNDFNEPDYLFINNQNGTFTDQLAAYFDHTSLFSMGSDVADINNDGLPDLVSLDMLPETNFLQKTHSGADNFDKVSLLIKNGFFRQYSRNMLQLNCGNGSFAEVAQLAGVSNTDWSWAALFLDFDNDGLKDLFISNGYLRDHTDMDFLKFTADQVIKIERGEKHVTFQEYLAAMPPINQPNYFFRNKGTPGIPSFDNMTRHWGLDVPSVSQGALYADLDNDGDLDLVTNNSENYATLYRNNADKISKNNYLRLKLLGPKNNPSGIGSKAWVYAGGSVFYQEQQPVRGFQSSMDPVLHFGLGKFTEADSLRVVWPTGETQLLHRTGVNRLLEVNFAHAEEKYMYPTTVIQPFFIENNSLLPFLHRENEFRDFKMQALLPWYLSREGPCIAIADVNGDRLEDVFFGNAKGSPASLLLQQPDGSFKALHSAPFSQETSCEIVDAAFFDADNDGDLDLYLACGSYDAAPDDVDRLYLNDGTGRFFRASLPPLQSAIVRAADVDADGDCDLFLGGYYTPGRYPESPGSRLLLNGGRGNFTEVPQHPLRELGRLKDALWLDLDGNGFPELVAAGEWSPVRVFQNDKGNLSEQTGKYLYDPAEGMWSALHAADFDGDGDPDLVAGNLGLNSQLRASPQEPLELFFGDFDQNGSPDPFLCYYVQGKSYPFASLEDVIGQLPVLKKRFIYFKDYATAQINTLLTPEQLGRANPLRVTALETVYLENREGVFHVKPLPADAQIAPVEAIVSLDVNADGHADLLLAGNKSHVRVKLGRLDGLHGLVLAGNGKGSFTPVPAQQTSLNLRGDTRALKTLQVGSKTALVSGVNDGPAQVYFLRSASKSLHR